MSANPSVPIVLLTDFGQADGYPGVMKGVIYSFCPGAPIIDLSHEIAAHHLRSAAFLLSRTCRYFPRGSIFTVVVDPGVGSGRKIVFLEWGDWNFLAPDNGVLTPFLMNYAQIKQIREVTQSDLFLERQGHTFDGRDRFAPVAAHLARGGRTEDLGPELDQPVMIDNLLPNAQWTGRSFRGQVLHIDHFGNLITNIEQDDLERLAQGRKSFVRIQGQSLPVVNSYSDVEPGQPLAVPGGFGCLEIAVNQGSANRLMRVAIGQSIEVCFEG
mgnify:CR=1 FL=1